MQRPPRAFFWWTDLRTAPAYVRALRGPAFFTIISTLGPLIGLLTGTLTARWLNPSEFGAIQTALLLSPYIAFVSLGVYSGLNRNYPYLIGQGEPERALAMVGGSWLVTKWATLATLVLSVGYAALVTLRSSDQLLISAVWCVIPVLVITPFATHYETLYRTSEDFLQFGWIQFWGYLFSVLTMGLVYIFRFWGQCIRLIVNAGFNAFLRWQKRPVTVAPAGNWGDARALIATGIPLLIVGYLAGLLAAADRSVIALRLGTEAVGYYSLATMVIVSMASFPMAVNQVLYPRAATRFGATGEPKHLRRYLSASIGLNLVFLVPLAVIGWFAMEPVVARLLPNYLPGVPMAQIALITGVVSLPGLGIIFAVLGHNRLYAVAIGVATAFIWLASLYVLDHGGNMIGVSWMRVAGALLLSGFTIVYALYLTR